MEGTEDKLKERKTKQALIYKKGTKEQPELQPGDTVRIKLLPTDNETLRRKGSVVKQAAPRSYEVDLQGTVLVFGKHFEIYRFIMKIFHTYSIQ